MTHQGSETFLRNLQSGPLKVEIKEIVKKRLNIEKSNKKHIYGFNSSPD